MKKILISLTLITCFTSLKSQNSEYRKRLSIRFHVADSLFNIDHKKDIEKLERDVNSEIKNVQKIINSLNINLKLEKFKYNKSKQKEKISINKSKFRIYNLDYGLLDVC